MALLPPSPIGQPPGNSFWNDWYEKLRSIVNTGAISIAWNNVTGTPTTLAGYGVPTTGSGNVVQATFPTITSPIINGGVGVPPGGLGANGDYYFRGDTPGVANQRIYIKIAGVWTGIV